MTERSFDAMIAYFNRRVADMDINQDYKMELLGMVTALGFKHEKSAQRWIPCNERMPKTTDYYLIQYSRHICQDEMAVAFYSVEEAELDKNYTWEFKPFADLKEVIAWMPLPKPYMEATE